jgi:diaminopimelate epimerase
MLNFHKYEGAGNDFIMINNLKGDIILTPEYISSICDRHFGIGADGVILLEKSDKADLSSQSPETKADCFMNYYNSDGSIAQMCGNGSRCTAKFFLEQTGYDLREINLNTRAGIKNIKINDDNNYSVNMGQPYFESNDFPSGIVNLEGFSFNCMSMGNPHAVTLVDKLENVDIKTIGPKIENNVHFPNKINVEFIEKISNDYYKVAVWERGCGVTLACGTGACAVFAILNKTEKFNKEITLEFPGGKLFLSQNSEGQIILRGPAKFSFKGEIEN